MGWGGPGRARERGRAALFVAADQELRNVIDKLAQFVARNGPEFEKMTMEKQKENPKFSFLFGGDFYGYYKYKLALEQQQRECGGRGRRRAPLGGGWRTPSPPGGRSLGGAGAAARSWRFGPCLRRAPRAVAPTASPALRVFGDAAAAPRV